MVPPLFVFLVPVIGETSPATSSGTDGRAFTAANQCTDRRSRPGTDTCSLDRLLLSIRFSVMASFDVVALLMVIVVVGLLRLYCCRAAN